MIIAIGTTNIIKIQALEEVIHNYPLFAEAKVHSFAVSSEIAEQPLSLDEIIAGAKNRAIALASRAVSSKRMALKRAF